MATNNFYNKNASNIFAVLMNYEQPILDDDGNETDETEWTSPDEWEYADLISELQYAMKNKFQKDFVSGGTDDNHRSFYGKAIGRYMTDKDYMGVTIEFELTAMIRSAYYEGANLDWELTYHVNGYSHDDIDEALSEWQYQAEKYYNAGLVKANLRHVESYMEAKKVQIVAELEQIFAEHCDTKLIKVGQFSNGEAVYKTA
jgi:hypothetical protein